MVLGCFLGWEVLLVTALCEGVIAADLRCAVSGFSLGVSGSLVAACSLVFWRLRPLKPEKGFFLLLV